MDYVLAIAWAFVMYQVIAFVGSLFNWSNQPPMGLIAFVILHAWIFRAVRNEKAIAEDSQ